SYNLVPSSRQCVLAGNNSSNSSSLCNRPSLNHISHRFVPFEYHQISAGLPSLDFLPLMYQTFFRFCPLGCHSTTDGLSLSWRIKCSNALPLLFTRVSHPL